jgi:hypothetical protein
MADEPEEKGEDEAEDETSDDGEVKSGVLAAMSDVAGKASEAKRQFAAEEEESADENEKAAEKKKGAAEFAERLHERIVEEEG